MCLVRLEDQISQTESSQHLPYVKSFNPGSSNFKSEFLAIELIIEHLILIFYLRILLAESMSALNLIAKCGHFPCLMIIAVHICKYLKIKLKNLSKTNKNAPPG